MAKTQTDRDGDGDWDSQNTHEYEVINEAVRLVQVNYLDLESGTTTVTSLQWEKDKVFRQTIDIDGTMFYITHYSYNELGLLISSETTGADLSAPITSRQFTYDDKTRLVGEESRLNGDFQYLISYEWSADNRLARESGMVRSAEDYEKQFTYSCR